MKFTTTTISIVLASTMVSAAPRGNNFAASKASAGAAFFMTNEPTGNFVVATNIGSDGKLTFSTAVATGGRGLHGNDGKNGPDPLFSQGSLTLGGNNLFVVNPGSDTISMFAINPKQPTSIKQVGVAVSSQGQFPVSVAFNKVANTLCSLNGGEINSVSCFKVDPKLGLISIPGSVRNIGLNQTTPATGPAGTASHIVMSEDGTQVFASIKGNPPTPGFVAVFGIDAQGNLSKDFNAVLPPTGGLLPFGMNVIPGASSPSVIVTDPGVGFEVMDLGASLASAAAGKTPLQSLAVTSTAAGGQSAATTVGGQVAVCWAAHSAKTGSFYLTDIGTSTVTEVAVDKSLKATIVKQYNLTAGSGTIDEAVGTAGGKDFLYVLAANASSIDVMALPAPGQATTIQSLSFAAAMKSAKIPINAANLQGMTVFSVAA